MPTLSSSVPTVAPGNGTIFHIVLPIQEHAQFDAGWETAVPRAAG